MQLFLGFQGRIGRREFWKGIAVLIVAAMVGAFAAHALPARAELGVLARGVLFLGSVLLLYPITALLVKRQHDRDKSSFPMVHLFLLVNAVNSAMRIFEIDYSVAEVGPAFLIPGRIAYAAMAASIVMSAWLIFWPGMRAGTRGSNSFGPDPSVDGKAA